jgi:hypothetical protein
MDPYVKFHCGSEMKTINPNFDGGKLPKWSETVYFDLSKDKE